MSIYPKAVMVLWLLAHSGCFRSGYSDFYQPQEHSGASDATTTEDAAPHFTVDAFEASWATPANIRWRWHCSGDAANFATYEVVLGTERDDVIQRTGDAVVLDSDNHPELGVFELPATLGHDQVLSTITFEHAAAHTYFGQLTLIDQQGRTQKSAVASALTADAAVGEITIFSEVPTSGYSVPSTFEYVDVAPRTGTHHYQWQVACPDSDPQCFENLRRQDIAVDLTSLSSDNFEQAHFEIAIASTSTVPSYWSQVRLWFGTDSGHEEGLYVLSGWSMRADGDYILLQFPLSEFVNNSQQLTFQATQVGLWEFSIGGVWSHGSTVRVDDISIKW